jgi:hypothetical protein
VHEYMQVLFQERSGIDGGERDLRTSRTPPHLGEAQVEESGEQLRYSFN